MEHSRRFRTVCNLFCHGLTGLFEAVALVSETFMKPHLSPSNVLIGHSNKKMGDVSVPSTVLAPLPAVNDKNFVAVNNIGRVAELSSAAGNTYKQLQTEMKSI